jgi:hypothetical protein
MADDKMWKPGMDIPQDEDGASVTKTDKKPTPAPKKIQAPQDIDGASATRSPKKGEKPVYEEPGSGIRVDGKPLNKAKGGFVSASSRADGMASRGKTRGKMC